MFGNLKFRIILTFGAILVLVALAACGGEERQSTGGTPIGPTNTPIVADPTATSAPAATDAPAAAASGEEATEAPSGSASTGAAPAAGVGRFPSPPFAML